ncbi:hypothetical protein EUTSA_v10017551mg, partial [Eutrema salsugineum]
AIDSPQGTKKVSICVDIDNDNKLKKHSLEAEKRLKKVDQHYIHTSHKYTETRSQWESLYDEKRRAVNRCSSAAAFIDWCNKLVDKLQKALEKLPTTETTTEETIDHNMQFSMFKSGKTSAQENMMIFRQKAECQKLNSEVIGVFKDTDDQLYYVQRKMPRIDSRKAVHGLLKKVCNSTNHESLRKSVELEIKQYATNIHKDFTQKVKRLEEKREHLSGQWDDERKAMLGMKKKNDRRIGTYPEAK